MGPHPSPVANNSLPVRRRLCLWCCGSVTRRRETPWKARARFGPGIATISTAMETGRHREQHEEWGVPREEWARLQGLLELVRREHQSQQLSAERQAEIRERVLQRLDQIEARRRRVRAFLASASAVLLAGLVFVFVIRAIDRGAERLRPSL